MHQIGITRDYIVLMDTAFKTGPEQLIPNPDPGNPDVETILREVLNYPLSPNTKLYIVPRADLQPGKSTVIAKKVVIPREIAHFLTDYDSPQGQITLHAGHNCAWDASEWVHDYDYVPDSEKIPVGHRLVGMSAGTMDINYLGRYVIDASTGKVTQQAVICDPDYTWATAMTISTGLLGAFGRSY
jgi:hypothetical protein